MNDGRSMLLPTCVATLGLAGCATVTSTPQTAAPPSDGLVYYMPMRPIVVKIKPPPVPEPRNSDATGRIKNSERAGDGMTNPASPASEKATDNKPTPPPPATAPAEPKKPADTYTVEVLAGDAYADLSQQYVLRMADNAVAQRSIKVGVTPQGLLGSATAESKSQAGDVLRALAAGAGSVKSLATLTPRTEVEKCQPGRTYVLIIDPKDAVEGRSPKSLCDFSIKVERLGQFGLEDRISGNVLRSSVRKAPSTSEQRRSDQNHVHPGVFYRQALPYRVTVSDPSSGSSGPSTQFLVFSPSEAPVLFLPAKKSFFAADNKIDLQFSDGILTSYSQEVDGELVALLKLPADILSAYFDAIGSMFPKKSTALKTEKEYIDAMNALALAKLKEQRCRDAVDAGDKDEIQTECGGDK